MRDNHCPRCQQVWPAKFKFCPECKQEIPAITTPPEEAVQIVRRQSAYSGTRSLLDAVLILGIVALIGPVVLFFMEITRNYYFIIIGAACLMNCILLRAIGHAIFDIADCSLAAADHRTFPEKN